MLTASGCLVYPLLTWSSLQVNLIYPEKKSQIAKLLSFVSWDLHVGKTLVFITFALLFHFLFSLWSLESEEFVIHQQAGQSDGVFTASVKQKYS